MKFYQNRTLEEQTNRLPWEIREEYKKTQLDRVEVFDGDNLITLQGYFEYSYMEEKSYFEQPIRSSDGSIQNIQDYKTFLTPRLIIRYSMMNIEDYRALMKIIKSHNSVIIICYDVVEDKRVKNDMYFAPPSMPKIYQQYLIASGIQEFSVELIGTNSLGRKCEILTHDKTYIYYIGMTWREFIESDLDSSPYVINGDYISPYSAQSGYRLMANGEYVKADDFIKTNARYTYG